MSRLRRLGSTPRRPFGLSTLAAAISNVLPTRLGGSGIVGVAAFGTNPGGLKMQVYAPPRLRAGRPLVVVLHGCGQDAAHFAADAIADVDRQSHPCALAGRGVGRLELADGADGLVGRDDAEFRFQPVKSRLCRHFHRPAPAQP